MTETRFILVKKFQVLVFISGISVLTLAFPEFHFIDTSKSYEDAKTHCREQFTDLASVHNQAEMNNLTALVSGRADRAWIGLEVGAMRIWHWVWPDQPVDYLNWRSGEPQTTDQDACAAMDQQGRWFESDCTETRRFVCGGDSESEVPRFIDSTKSWRGAQTHCRGLSLDLVSILSERENQAVLNLSTSHEVWIGLFKDPWQWADGSNSSFRYWKSGQPNYLEDQDCTVAVFKDDGKWNDRRCKGKHKFVCQGERVTTTTISPTTTEESTTISTPNMTTNMTTTTIMTSTTNTITNMTTNTPTNITNMTTTNMTTNTTTNITTNMTVNTTMNMTENSTTTNMPTNTPINMTTNTTNTTTPGLTTVNTTNGIHNTTAMEVNTTAHNTTQLPTVTPTGDSPPAHSESLILIQQNLSWLDAMSYCREHHHDLVHISTQIVQQQVAEMAKNATSPHVWIGLRYTCKFNFWFWAGSTSTCYQNWAPGQGLERTYDCGVTGAVEATGGQQWVGLPETERLNFICSACAG